jgi:DNA-binding NarL/FixJ family response regulator
MAIEVLIVGPHAGLAEALRFALGTRDELAFVGWARDASDLEQMVDAAGPDLVVVGAELSADTVAAVRRLRPRAAVVQLGESTGTPALDDAASVLVLPDDSSFADVLATLVGVVDDTPPSHRGA